LFEKGFEYLKKKEPKLHYMAIWGTDGIELKKEHFNGFTLDYDLVSAQISDVINRIEAIQPRFRSVSIELNWDLERFVIQNINEQYVLILLTSSDVPFSKMRYYAARVKEMILAEL
jgi:predicted regulator of Ras-like GTPase activity (Roadblock/LC7/MglB family)